MSAMRPIALLLLITAAASAQDPFAATLERFEKAAARTPEPGAHAQINAAVEDLVATGDVRAVQPLLQQLVATYERERILFKLVAATQKAAADAAERATAIERELGFFRLKENAGDPSAGPTIEKLVDEQKKQVRVIEETRGDVSRADRTITFVRDLREKLLVGCVQVLKGLEGEALEAGLGTARQVLGVADRDRALVLVRVLRTSGAKQAESHLLDVLANLKVDGAVLRAAQYAVVPLMTRRGAETLLRVWERDPEGRGKHARHAMSLAAKKNLADLEAARAWVESLGG
jgi:hypothetical protein